MKVKRWMSGVRGRSHVFICFNYYAGTQVFFFTAHFDARSACDRVGIFTDESNSFRSSGQTRVDGLSEAAVSGPRRPVSGESILVSDGAGGAAHAATHGSQAEMAVPPALHGRALLKFETPVHLAVRPTPASRIRPSNPAIASRRSTIAEGAKPLLRYIPETKNVDPGAAGRRGGRLPCAICGGISRGTLLAVLDAPAGGRHEVTKRWGGQLVNKQSGKRR